MNEIRTLQDVADRLDRIEQNADDDDMVSLEEIETLKLDIEITIRREADARREQAAALAGKVTHAT